MRSDSPAMYQYSVNAIPTTYTDGKGNVTNTYQLDREIELRNRVTETHYLRPLERTSSLMPGVYFVYEFSPLRSIIKETHLPFYELCTSLCAILGGVFTVMGMVDGIIFSLAKRTASRSGSTESELIQKVASKAD